MNSATTCPHREPHIYQISFLLLTFTHCSYHANQIDNIEVFVTQAAEIVSSLEESVNVMADVTVFANAALALLLSMHSEVKTFKVTIPINILINILISILFRKLPQNL